MRTVSLPRSARLLMLTWLFLVLAPLATVGSASLLHALLYLAPALVFLVPLCLNRDPAGDLVLALARGRRRSPARRAPAARAGLRSAVAWVPRGGLLIRMAHAGRPPPAMPRSAVPELA